eukprot:480247-Prymnesium_polylepis.1
MGDNESRLSEPWFGESLLSGLKPPDCQELSTSFRWRLQHSRTAIDGMRPICDRATTTWPPFLR